MSIAIGNPWDVSATSSFRSLAGAGARHLLDTYRERDYSDRFRERLSLLTDEVKSNNIYRNAVGSLRRLKHGRGENAVRQLGTIGELQNAPKIMQGGLVANPAIRSLYNRRMCEGYGETFAIVDKWRGNAIKHTDPYYRAVMNKHTDEESLKCYTYAMTDDERQLYSSSEQIDIQVSWKHQLRLMRDSDDDVTSPSNAARGM